MAHTSHLELRTRLVRENYEWRGIWNLPWPPGSGSPIQPTVMDSAAIYSNLKKYNWLGIDTFFFFFLSKL